MKSWFIILVLCGGPELAGADALSTNAVSDPAAPAATTNLPVMPAPAGVPDQRWNWHIQTTEIVQGDPGFHSQYSGPNSLNGGGETDETAAIDLFLGLRLWQSAEIHLDALAWQGFGLSKTEGIEAFPSGEAYRLGSKDPNVTLAQLFFRQTINLGGEEETVPDDLLTLAGTQGVSRLTFTVGAMSVLNIFDNNTYAHDPTTQFMNWAFVANEAWDYPANSLGYTTGIAVELNQPVWSLRYGFFQVPDVANGMGMDEQYLEAWGMVAESERRYAIKSHPGAIRFLAYINQARMGAYSDALAEPSVNLTPVQNYTQKYGFGLNWEQEVATNIGIFSRLGWSDGRTETWMYADVDRTASLGLSVKGAFWNRPNDTYGLAAVVNGITAVHQEFLAAGGTGILAGDGTLNYGLEQAMETYYDFQVWKNLHAALDFQYVINPAYNRDRGPVPVLGARIHWQF